MANFKMEGVSKGDSFTIRDLAKIVVTPGFNGRTIFSPEKLRERADSILAIGQVTPVLVRKRKGEDCFDLVDGECRLRAIQMLRAEGHEVNVKAVLFSGTDQEAAVAMAVANIDREDFSPIDEANIVKRFVTWGWSDQEIAQKLGKSIGWVVTRHKFAEASPELRARASNGQDHRFDVLADIAASVPETEQIAVLDAIVQEAQEAAQEASEKTGSRIKPNVRRVASEVLAARTGKVSRPGAQGKLGIKELRGVRDEFLARLVGHETEYLFSSEEMVAVFMLACGEVNTKEFWKLIRQGLKAQPDVGEVPAWFVNAELPKPRKRGRPTTKKED